MKCEAISELRKRLVCGECHAIKIRAPSGMVCPEGCGRLVATINRWRIRRVEWAASFPMAHRDGSRRGQWTITGRDGLWVIAPFERVEHGVSVVGRRIPTGSVPYPGMVFAILVANQCVFSGNHIRQFEPIGD